jgi:hypothetical protein
MNRILAAMARRLRQLLLYAGDLLAIDLAGTYRPEAHYMRGPGRKWRAKHAGSERR